MEHTDREIKRYFRNIFGFRVRNVEPFRIALTHKSVSSNDVVGGRLNNERLEYLGDAILGAIIADFLFHKYPLEYEGVLTRMRSKLVNRNRLNNLARKIGLPEMMRMDNHISSNTPNGNAFEAVVGAIYMDQGFKKTYDIVLRNVFLAHLDIDAIFVEDDDYKSRVLIWAQHNRRKVTFTAQSLDSRKDPHYRVVLSLDGKEWTQGLGNSVKKAEQAAAEKALALLKEGEA
ncbi:MAG: hypothetical protein J5799_01780 [Bacteroidales bacterium]|nr:hypothetical protein [Bacteroidales bacterium]